MLDELFRLRQRAKYPKQDTPRKALNMLQDQLNKAVSRATGEDRHVINGRGFSLVCDESALMDSDIEALVEAWDELEAELSIPASSDRAFIRLNPHIAGNRLNSARKARKSMAQYRSKTRLTK